MGSREKAADLDFSAILEEDVEEKVKDAAVVSMGTEMSSEDLLHVSSLCDQVIDLSEYRGQLYSYLKNRMQVCFTCPACFTRSCFPGRLLVSTVPLKVAVSCA